MNATAIVFDSSASLETIRTSLQTDVIGVIQKQIDLLRPLERQAAYDKVLNNPNVLDGCFRLFRAKPELFEGIITDEHGALVTQNHAVLSCGRTLADAISLLVRASAKRYFRANNARIGDGTAGSADVLYNAMKDVLLYEWQTRLIPSYIRLTVPMIKKLGTKILSFYEPSEITGLADDPENAFSRRPPLLLDMASRVMIKGREVIDPEILWDVCQQLNLGRLYPESDAKALRIVVSQIAAAQAAPLSAMASVLGKDIRLFCVFLFVVHADFGYQRYRALYGEGGQFYVVRRWMARLQESPLPHPRFDEMVGRFQEVIHAGATSELDDKARQ